MSVVIFLNAQLHLLIHFLSWINYFENWSQLFDITLRLPDTLLLHHDINPVKVFFQLSTLYSLPFCVDGFSEGGILVQSLTMVFLATSDLANSFLNLIGKTILS